MSRDTLTYTLSMIAVLIICIILVSTHPSKDATAIILTIMVCFVFLFAALRDNDDQAR